MLMLPLTCRATSNPALSSACTTSARSLIAPAFICSISPAVMTSAACFLSLGRSAGVDSARRLSGAFGSASS